MNSGTRQRRSRSVATLGSGPTGPGPYRQRSIVLISFLAVAVMISGVRAATLHVPGDCSTIWQAIDAATAGDSVLVGPGTWTDTDTRPVQLGSITWPVTSCGFLKGGVTVIGLAGAAMTVVDAGGGNALVDTFILANEPVGETVIEGLNRPGNPGGSIL